MAKMAAPPFAKEWCIQAADEIERLMKQNKQLLLEAEEFRKYVLWASNEIEMKQKRIAKLETGVVKSRGNAMIDRSSADRAYLCHLMRISAEWLPSFHADVMERAANEIEQLAKNLQFQYISEKAQQQEIERLAADNKRLQAELEGLPGTAGAE